MSNELSLLFQLQWVWRHSVPELTLPEVERMVFTCRAVATVLMQNAVYLRPKRKMRTPHGTHVTTRGSITQTTNYRDGKRHGLTSATCQETRREETIGYWNGLVHGKHTMRSMDKVTYDADVVYNVPHGHREVYGLVLWYAFGECIGPDLVDNSVHTDDPVVVRARMRTCTPYDPRVFTQLIQFE
jgi:hypothetical protein